MRRFALLLSLTLSSVCLAEAPKPEAAADPKAGTQAAASGNAFGFDLYRRVAAADKGNLFLSPYSIETALAMTYAGAKGETAEQMARVLHFDLPADATQAAFGSLQRQLNDSADTGIPEAPAFELTVANALWLEKSFGINPAFTELVQKHYGAGLESLNFTGGPQALEQSRKTINGWVEKQTHDRIKDLLAPGSLNAETRMVLTNAIYFKGRWEDVFQESATRDEAFHVSAATTRPVPMMHQTRRFAYSADENVQVVELPYTFHHLSMVVLLPKKTDALADVEKSITPKQFDAWREAAREYEVDLSLPRFKFDSRFELAQMLEAMGMRDAFSDQADFSGISQSDRLSLQNVIHKAFVACDEKGTEAAAVTAVAFGAAELPSRPPEKVTFRADHPFVFAIRDNASGSILFLGRVNDPATGG